MEIILLEENINLGKLGDIVHVRNGYARNYLIPKRKAKRATEAIKAQYEAQRAEMERIKTDKFLQAKSQSERLKGMCFKIKQKAGIDGRLFGSVTNSDIAQILTNQDFIVKKSQVRLPNGPLKTIGKHTVIIVLHAEVQAKIVIQVVRLDDME